MSELFQGIADLSPRRQELLLRLLRSGQDGAAERPRIERLPADSEGEPLSFAQERLWFLQQLQPEASFYNSGVRLHLTGPLAVPALAASLAEILCRHEVLRARFPRRPGGPVQVSAPPQPGRLPVADLQGLPGSRGQEEAHRLLAAFAAPPFDLARGPVLRALLIRRSPTEHLLTVVIHHIAFDGWSLGVFVRELEALYRAALCGEVSPLAGLPVRYADFARWQRGRMQGEELERQLAYWRRQLAEVPMLRLPTDRPRPAAQRFRGWLRHCELPAGLAGELRELARAQRTTLFAALLAAFKLLLARYCGQRDLAVGSAVASRDREELEGLIGCLVNTLVLRTDLAGDPPLPELLARVRKVALAAYAHQDLPFEKLVAELQPERGAGWNPLFQAMFALQNAPVPKVELAGGVALGVPRLELETSAFDLHLSLWERGGGLEGYLQYDTDLFDGATAERMIAHFGALLAGVARTARGAEGSPWDLPLLGEEQRHQVLVEWNGGLPGTGEGSCVHHLVAAQARRTPHAVALVDGERHLTYGELAARAGSLARCLRRRGVGRRCRWGSASTAAPRRWWRSSASSRPAAPICRSIPTTPRSAWRCCWQSREPGCCSPAAISRRRSRRGWRWCASTSWGLRPPRLVRRRRRPPGRERARTISPTFSTPPARPGARKESWSATPMSPGCSRRHRAGSGSARGTSGPSSILSPSTSRSGRCGARSPTAAG